MSVVSSSIPSPVTADEPVDGCTADDDCLARASPHLLIAYDVEDLPSYTSSQNTSFTWHEIDGIDFIHMIDSTYSEVIHWRRNLFKVPSGKSGKAFVREMARLFSSYGEGSAMESIALKAAFTLPALVLQKPHARSKAKDHCEQLLRRMEAWRIGDLNSLLLEGRVIQQQLRQTSKRSDDKANLAQRFATLVKEGKLKAAMRMLEDSSCSTLPLNDEVKQTLRNKHPPRQPANKEALATSPDTPNHFHPIAFEQIDGKLILDSALKSDGAAGPSGLDAAAWKRLCSSFGQSSLDLCNAVAKVAKRICSAYVDPKGLMALVACRLIALDKCPGVRPIGIGEVVRRIIGRAVLSIFKTAIQEAVDVSQLCAGQEAGCEAAIHALRRLFENDSTAGVLLVDASNAFNSLNRENALRSIQSMCPQLAPILVNTYRDDIPLFIDGEMFLSQEGTTQGDPLAMAMYALAVTPLIAKLQIPNTNQVWFADDASASAELQPLRTWWDSLLKLGPDFGYFPNAQKSWLLVKDDRLEEAMEIFEGSGLNVTTEGRSHLGSALGDVSFVESFVRRKVELWAKEVERLATIAETQPHAAYVAFTRCTMSKWNFLLRTTPEIADMMQPIEDTITAKLIPALTGREAISPLERELLSLPARLGGLGIEDPTQKAETQYQGSKEITTALVALILGEHDGIDLSTSSIKNEVRRERLKKEKQKLDSLMSQLPPSTKKAVELASEKGVSTWLTAMPIEEHGFFLYKGDFRDAIALRYGWSPSRLPRSCVCGQSFSVDHCLTCPCGGFPSLRHNEIRDITADLLSEVCHNVGIEPSLQPLSGELLHHTTANRKEGARLDVVADNFWGKKRRAFFDVRVFHPLAPSYRRTQTESCYRSQENIKKRAYDERVRHVEGGTFSPLIFSTSGGMGPTAKIVYKKIAAMIAEKRDQSYSITIKWIRCRLSFALIRSSIMCLRGHRSTRGHPARAADDMIVASTECCI